MKEYKRRNGAIYYNVDWITKIWGKGHVVIAPAEWKAMAYTARYTTKRYTERKVRNFTKKWAFYQKNAI